MLLDASGSMSRHTENVVSTFFEYYSSTKDSVKHYTVYKFSEELTRLHHKQKEFSQVTYTCDYGLTALLDSIKEVVELHEDCKRPVHLIIHTDGMDNRSSSSKEEIEELLRKMEHSNGWLITFLGEGLEGISSTGHFLVGTKVNLNDLSNRSHALSKMAEYTTVYADGGLNTAMKLEEETF